MRQTIMWMPWITGLSSLSVGATSRCARDIPTGIVRRSTDRPELPPLVDSCKLVAISLSTAQNPTSFDNFTNSTGALVRNFATGSGAGNFCIPLDLSNTGISSVSDGANVTIQIIYNGGDGSLYQVNLRVLHSSSTYRTLSWLNFLFPPSAQI